MPLEISVTYLNEKGKPLLLGEIENRTLTVHDYYSNETVQSGLLLSQDFTFAVLEQYMEAILETHIVDTSRDITKPG